MKSSNILAFVLGLAAAAPTATCLAAPQDAVFDITQYGAKGDGLTLNTAAIDSAIAACARAGGGTINVPAGTFVTGSVRLYSNMCLCLGPGAVLLASADPKDYKTQQTYGFTGYGAGNKLGILFAVHAENVSITGPGIIDGRPEASLYMDSVQQEEPAIYTRQGKNYMGQNKAEAPVMWRGLYQDRPGPEIVCYDCKNLTLSEFTIRNAADWSIAIVATDGAHINNLTIRNNMSVPNSDGMDFYDCTQVIVSDCDIRAGDDAIAVISTSNLVATNCTLSSRSSGIRIGYNAFNTRNSGNLLFDNIRIYASNRGIGIFQRQKGDMENMIFSNMIIDTRLFPGEWWGHGKPIHISALPGLGNKEVGRISHLRFSHIIARGEEGIVLYGSATSVLNDIRFEDVSLTIAYGPETTAYGGNFDLRPTNNPETGLFRHDIPAIYAQYVDGLSLQNVDIHWEGDLPGYFTKALDYTHATHVTLDKFTGPAAHRARQ